MTLPMTRSEIFHTAWKMARSWKSGYPTIRAAFAVALRNVWEIVKVVMAETAPRPVVAAPVRSEWANSNVHRAAAVARAGGSRWSNSPTSFNW